MFWKKKVVKPKKIDPVKAKKIIDKKMSSGIPLTIKDIKLCRAIRKHR